MTPRDGYHERPKEDYWFRFTIGERVEGIPTSATLAGRRGIVVGYSPKSDAMCVVVFDDEPAHDEHITVSLLRKLDVVTRLGEIAP